MKAEEFLAMYDAGKKFSEWQIADMAFALTENQENEYPNQPVEVRKKTYQKTITVTEYEPVK